MRTTLTDICLASLPPEQLPLLAEVRCLPGVYVVRDGGRLWVRWEPAAEQVLRTVLPVPGVRLYARRPDGWYPAGRELPDFDVPAELEGRPLSGELLPAPVETVSPPLRELRPELLRLVADHHPREASAYLCTPAELQEWADTVSAWRLAGLDAACQDSRVLLLGKQLPLFRVGRRYWGSRILVPIGFRPDPLLPEQTLAEAVGLAEQELLLWQEERTEVISLELFEPLTRTRIRLLKQQHEPGQ